MSTLSTSVSGQISLLQEVDPCGKKDAPEGKNTLTLNVCDAGDGPYVVVKTDRYVLDADSAIQLANTISRLLNTLFVATEEFGEEAEEEGEEEAEQS